MGMYVVEFERCAASGRRGRLRIAGGIWVGDECVFEFADAATGMAGVLRCDWRRSEAAIDVLEGRALGADGARLCAELRALTQGFHTGAFAGIPDGALASFYAGDYHRRMGLATNVPFEIAHKARDAELIARSWPDGRLLDAGCSAGELVRQLRARGLDAHGFDLCPDLATVAYPEVRPFVRQGSVTAIPYGPEDGFETLVALDVFEHVPEDRVPAMVAEFARLGVRRVAAHIALCEFEYGGHVTLRPLSWWDRALLPWFRRSRDAATLSAVCATYGGDPARFLRVFERVQVPALLA